MLFQKINRADSEKVYVTVTNAEGATITTGYPVAYARGAGSMDGVNAVIANAAGDYPGFMGVAFKDIPVNGYGLVQVSGYVASVLVSNVGTSITINVGDPLVPAPAGFFSAAPTYANSGFKFIAAATVPTGSVVSAASYVTGLIKSV